MSIKIVTDSTCDLLPSVIANYGITVLPLYIHIGNQGYLDGIEMSLPQFYQQLRQNKTTTAAPGSELFRQTYQRLADEGATGILSIHVSSNFSATIDGARIGAKQVQDIPVKVFDSRQISLGMGFMVLTAAQAAAEGCQIDEIIARLDEQVARTHLFAAVDTLEYLQRSGRINGTLASLGSLLRIKPLFKLYNGKTSSEKVRTNRRVMKRLVSLVGELGPLEQVALVHAQAPERAEDLRQRAKHLLPQGDVPAVDITPVIGAHIGPGAVGFVCVTAP